MKRAEQTKHMRNSKTGLHVLGSVRASRPHSRLSALLYPPFSSGVVTSVSTKKSRAAQRSKQDRKKNNCADRLLISVACVLIQTADSDSVHV